MTSSTLGRSRVVAAGAAVALLSGALFASSVVARHDASASGDDSRTPTDRKVEAASGIRVLGAHVVGSGGIIELTYQVLNPAKASIVEGDVNKTPLLTDVGTGEELHDTAAMRHGHNMRPAGTYFLLYYNKGNVVGPGDHIDVTINGTTLKDVPVS
jgi:hypothetical protein